ncbi:MAG: helix-turn-helix transcriptional regulator [Bacillota bacterium]
MVVQVLHAIPLLEREMELAEVDQLLAQAAEGRGGLLLLGGEAGIGKSALLEAIQARAGGFIAVVGYAPGRGETPLYGPLLQVVQRLAAQYQVDPSSLPPPFGEGPVRLAPFAQAGALAHWLGSLSKGPVLVAVEDIHWADSATLELLKHLPGHLTDQPVLVVATYRTDELNREHPVWALLPYWQRLGAHRILLRRLTPQAVAEMAALALRDRPDLEELTLRLYQRTGGLPLFVQEMLHSLAANDHHQSSFLPETLQQVIDSLLARLTPETQEVLQAAAVIGEHFAWPLLEQVTGYGEERLLAAVEEALAFNIIRQVAESGDRFRFDHALVRERLQERLIGPRRKRWHLRVAEALLPDTAADVEAVAYHLRHAGDERAISYLRKAGERSFGAGFLTQAARYFTQALELAGTTHPLRAELLFCLGMTQFESDYPRFTQLMQEARQEAEMAGDRFIAFLSRLKLVQSLSRQVDFAQLLSDLDALAQEEATIACNRLPLPGLRRSVAGLRVHRLAEAARSEEVNRLITELRAGPLTREESEALQISELWLAIHTGRFSEAIIALNHAIGLRLENHHLLYAVLLQFLKLLLLLISRADSPEELDHAAEAGLALEERMRQRAGVSIQAGGYSRVGFYRFFRGDWERGVPDVLAGLAAGGDRSGYLHQAAARVLLALGRPTEALDALASLRPGRPYAPFALTDSPFPFEVFDLRVQAHLMLGEVEQGRAWVETGEEWVGQGDFLAGRSAVCLARARLCLRTGDLEGARSAAARAVSAAEAVRHLWDLITARRMLGEAQAGLGLLAEAEKAFETSLELAERCQFPYEAALTQLAWGRALKGAPRARTLLEAARATFARLGAAPALAEAEAQLAPLPTPAASMALSAAAEAPSQAELTEREAEVVRLVARGLSDKEVAAQLHISPRTVDGHMRNVYGKLFLNSRAALTAWAIRHGLAE